MASFGMLLASKKMGYRVDNKTSEEHMPREGGGVDQTVLLMRMLYEGKTSGILVMSALNVSTANGREA